MLDDMVSEVVQVGYRQRENLIAAAIAQYGEYGLKATDFMLVERRDPDAVRFSVEPVTDKLRDDRLACLNEENKLLRQRVIELERENATLLIERIQRTVFRY